MQPLLLLKIRHFHVFQSWAQDSKKHQWLVEIEINNSPLMYVGGMSCNVTKNWSSLSLCLKGWSHCWLSLFLTQQDLWRRNYQKSTACLRASAKPVMASPWDMLHFVNQVCNWENSMWFVFNIAILIIGLVVNVAILLLFVRERKSLSASQVGSLPPSSYNTL